MNTSLLLDTLETAGLVRTAEWNADDEYVFRHGLLQETAYRSLLRQERSGLHLAVGDALERAHAHRTEEYAPLLGHHFLQGGDDSKALRYLMLAGEVARSRYANAEALEYYSQAIEVAGREGAREEAARLHRWRGLTHEIVGEFDAALADQQSALEIGRLLHDARIEWRALLDLGKLWASRDYARTGEYFQAAVELARGMNEPSAVARSLNRLGNWYINTGNPAKAKASHLEALEIFEALDDPAGIAETLDFLGMANFLSSDVTQGAVHYDKAIPMFRRLDDKQRLASTLTARALRSGLAQSNTVFGVLTTPEDALSELDEALAISREIGWRSGECFALWMKGFLQGSTGQLGQALENARVGLEIANEIDHLQWRTAAQCALGLAFAECLRSDQARAHLEEAVERARQTGSQHWISITSGSLATTYTQEGDLASAKSLLDLILQEQASMEILGNRLCWTALAELRLAQGDPQGALGLIEQLFATAPGPPRDRTIPRLARARGLAHQALDSFEEAESDLLEAVDGAARQGARSLLWRIHCDLARFYGETGRADAARAQAHQAEELLDQLSHTLPEKGMRHHFLETANAHLERIR